jgi:microcystin-dependent protein
MEGIIGYTTIFAGNFAPRSWAFCQGQIIPIASNTALFSILGTTYGGNGTTTFALPDLRGRTVVGAGQGPGTNNYSLGQPNGLETNTITLAQMPAHVHPVQVVITPVASNDKGSTSPIGGAYGNGTELLYNPSGDSTFKAYPAALTMQNIGNSQAFSTLHPVLGLNYVICLQGIYPSRN